MTTLGMVARMKTYGDVATGITAAGSTAATATTLPATHCTVTTSTTLTADGVIMQAGNYGSFRTVTNKSTTGQVRVYPPTGSNFNGATANLPVTIPPNKAAWMFFISTTDISVITN